MKRFAILVAFLLLLIALPIAYFASVNLNDFEQPLLNASRDGDTAEILTLLANGMDPNISDPFQNTPLSIAAHFGQTEAVEMLLANGAKIDGIRGEMTPLQCAVYSGHTDTVAFLLQRNADPNLADEHGVVPLAVAARNGNAALVRTLLDSGANIEHKDNDGWRALHVALRSTQNSEPDRLSTVRTLLGYGADPNAENPGGFEADSQKDSHLGFRKTLPNQGNTPVAIAKSNGFTELVAELKKHGGT